MEKYEAFLFDVGLEIKERARQAKQKRNSYGRGSEQHSVQVGRVLAFSEVLTILQETAEALNIPLSALRIEDIDPDSELL
jgi:hypothetical protein